MVRIFGKYYMINKNKDTIRKHTAIFFSLTLGKKEGAVRLSTLSVKGFGVTVAYKQNVFCNLVHSFTS